MPVGGRVQYRHLGRDAAHRKALLRNLVTSLIKHESIQTTWAKAKEAQRLAEKLITLGKKNTPASRLKAQAIFFEPHQHLPKLFGYLRHRYAARPGGYTRVLRIEPLKEDQAPSAILELVDSPKDMRFALTAQTVARDRALGRAHTALTKLNVKKVTQFRAAGAAKLEDMVDRIALTDRLDIRGRRALQPRKLMLGNSGRGDVYYQGSAQMAAREARRAMGSTPRYNT